MRIVAYTRVSTAGQVAEDLGLEIQREQIQKWAKGNGHRVVSWETDEAVSGAKDSSEREGLASALQAICSGRASGLVIAKLDRLARSLTVQEAALAHVWNCGGTVFAVDQGEVLRDDPDDPMRTAMRQMAGVFGQLEKSMISKRLRDGRQLKRDKGGYVSGAPAFGYYADPDTKELRPHEAEADAMFLMAMLRASSKSVREIAHSLETEGHRPKRGGTWNPGTLSRILKKMESVMDRAPKDLLAALREAREVNVLVEECRGKLDPAAESKVTLALQRQGQGFRGVLYAKTLDEKREGLRVLRASTHRAMKELAKVNQ